MEYKWMNSYTGEIFKTLRQGVKTAIKDMVKIKNCRTVKILRFEKIK